MSMSKKQFIELADCLRQCRDEIAGRTDLYTDRERRIARSAYQVCEGRIAKFCGEQNPEFKLERWLDYIDGKCGPSGGAVKKVCAKCGLVIRDNEYEANESVTPVEYRHLNACPVNGGGRA